jgi:hypothetical protein
VNAPRENKTLGQDFLDPGHTGKLDECDEVHAIGWAMRPAVPEERVVVELVVDGVPVARAIADGFRDDVAAAGMGDGRY